MNPLITTQKIAGADGVSLNTLVCGKGKLVLFLHGFPEFAGVWSDQLQDFGRDHLAAAIDLRGYGLSDKPAEVGAYALDHVIKDIRCVVEQLSPGQPAILVGHDWGGIIGWAFARAYPRLLERLVVINAPHPAIFARELVENKAQRFASSYMLFFRSQSVAEEVLSAFDFALLRRMVFGRTTRPEAFGPDLQRTYLQAWREPSALRGGLNYYRASQSFRQARLEDWRILVPTLVLWGEADPALLTGNLAGLEGFVRELTVRRHPTATHWIHHEEPEWVGQAIRGWLGRPAPAVSLPSLRPADELETAAVAKVA